MRKKYRVWRVVINVLGHHLAARCRHDTDNLNEVREYYMKIYRNRGPIRLYYTEFTNH